MTLSWSAPAADATLTGTVQLRLTGQAFRNVEIFRNGAMIARATIAADGRSATASIDSRTFADGALTLTAHAWNSAPGTSFTSEADAGARRFTVRNAATATASIDTKQFPNGAVMLTAHGWNSSPGQPSSSGADAR